MARMVEGLWHNVAAGMETCPTLSGCGYGGPFSFVSFVLFLFPVVPLQR